MTAIPTARVRPVPSPARAVVGPDMEALDQDGLASEKARVRRVPLRTPNFVSKCWAK